MSGFDTNRIVGLDSRFAETIQCSICLLILNNPLMTKCGHNYCNQCLKQVIESGRKECPKCRKTFTKKRPKESLDDSCVDIRNNKDVFVFFKNLTLKEIIGKLKIKCDYESNGCKESVELESLSQHMTRCEYNLCETCGLCLKEQTIDHKCIEVLKNNRQEWKERYHKSLIIIKQSEDRLKKVVNENKELLLNYAKSLETNKKLNEKLMKVEQLYDKEKSKATNNLNRVESHWLWIDCLQIGVIVRTESLSNRNPLLFVAVESQWTA